MYHQKGGYNVSFNKNKQNKQNGYPCKLKKKLVEITKNTRNPL